MSHRLDSYYEIDLPTVLEEGDLEGFKYFYLFFRHEAFLEDASGDCFLDDVYDESNLFSQELGEDLQGNIYDAIKVLSEGFLQYPDNDLSEGALAERGLLAEKHEDFERARLDLVHDSALICLYRLIFVLYAESESRELLETDNAIYEDFYSLNSLKETVAEELDSASPKYQPWMDDLWSRLDGLFELIDQGSESRGIDPRCSTSRPIMADSFEPIPRPRTTGRHAFSWSTKPGIRSSPASSNCSPGARTVMAAGRSS
jgi:type II restriction/modification system DNA methylase subunit YeeA